MHNRCSARPCSAGAARSSLDVFALFSALLLAAALLLAQPAHAMKIQTVKSPGGIEAWLVEDHSLPLMAMRFGFRGGSAQDPKGKEGVSNFLSAMLDEGAGDMTSSAFQERMEEIAMRMSFSDGRDAFYGSFQTLTEHRDEAVRLLNLAVTKPRFDDDAVERIKKQLLAGLVNASRDPNKVAAKAWFKAAFPNHPYGRSSTGSMESVATIGSVDLEALRKRTFARSDLKVAVVGDIDPDELGSLLDKVFGDLPAKAELAPVAKAAPAIGISELIDMPVPQSVAVFGMGSIARKDPDFIPAFVLNHILGGGTFASQLMTEVREKRGLTYSVHTYLQPEDHAAVMLGQVATKNEKMAETLNVIRDVFDRMASVGPTEAELEDAKQYLIGSYALRFDTSSKIANQLLGVQMEDLGIDYFDKRNDLVAQVTLDDIKRVARRLLKPKELNVTIVGRPLNMMLPVSTGAQASGG